jgi:hypothetical protein
MKQTKLVFFYFLFFFLEQILVLYNVTALPRNKQTRDILVQILCICVQYYRSYPTNALINIAGHFLLFVSLQAIIGRVLVSCSTFY